MYFYILVDAEFLKQVGSRRQVKHLQMEDDIFSKLNIPVMTSAYEKRRNLKM